MAVGSKKKRNRNTGETEYRHLFGEFCCKEKQRNGLVVRGQNKKKHLFFRLNACLYVVRNDPEWREKVHD